MYGVLFVCNRSFQLIKQLIGSHVYVKRESQKNKTKKSTVNTCCNGKRPLDGSVRQGLLWWTASLRHGKLQHVITFDMNHKSDESVAVKSAKGFSLP